MLFAFGGAALPLIFMLARPLPSPSAEPDIRRDATVAAVERVMPSVVNIGTKTKRERRGLMWDWYRENWSQFTQQLPAQESAGSGVIIDEEGYVLTAAHVVDGADEIWVKLYDNRIVQAKLVTGTRKSDVALLQLITKNAEKFPAAKLATDDDLLLGETVIALGNPFGLGGSVSRGILSSGPRRAATDDEPLKLPDWLQTDAAINPGNSGGPLINLRGELIGINNAVFTRGQGIGFAIPVKRVAEAISEIITPETTNKRLWFGARFHPGALPLRVAEVQPGSPAEKAGLRAGDDLVSYNERPAKSFFRTTIELTEAGGVGEIALVIRRGAELKKLTARMVPEKEFFNAEIISKKLGVTLQELTPALADSLGFTPKAGLLVASIEQDSPAAGAGLQAKMLVRGVDGFATTDIVDAAKLLFAKKRGDRVKLDVLIQRQRNGFTYTTQHAVELPVR